MMLKFKKFFHFSISFLVIITLFEFYFRVMGISLPSFVYDDRDLGRTHKAGREIFSASAEGFCIDEVNNFGYTGIGYPPSKKPGTIRIALFGSSYIEGLQVFRRNRFSIIFEKQINNFSDTNIEVLNFAIGGDDFRGMFFRYLKFSDIYNTDYNLFFIQNQALIKNKTIPSPEIFFKDDSIYISGKYLLDNETKLRQTFSFIRNSSVGNLFKEGFEVYYSGRLGKIVFDKLWSYDNNIMERGLSECDNFYDLNLRIFNSLNKENEKGLKNILVLMDSVDIYYADYLKNLNIPIINLSEKLNSYDYEELHFWKASGKIGHWNNFAHNVVGYSLANEFEKFIKNENKLLTRINQENHDKNHK